MTNQPLNVLYFSKTIDVDPQNLHYLGFDNGIKSMVFLKKNWLYTKDFYGKTTKFCQIDLEREDQITDIRFSPNKKHACVILIHNKSSLSKIISLEKAKSKTLNFLSNKRRKFDFYIYSSRWINSKEIIFVHTFGFEHCYIGQNNKHLKIQRFYKFSPVYGFTSSSSNQLLLLSMGKNGDTIIPFRFNANEFQKLKSFETDSCPMGALATIAGLEDVSNSQKKYKYFKCSARNQLAFTKNVIISKLYNKMYVIQLIKTRTDSKIILYHLGKVEIKKTILKTENLGNFFYLTIIDNLLIIHKTESKNSFLYDLNAQIQGQISQTLIIDNKWRILKRIDEKTNIHKLKIKRGKKEQKGKREKINKKEKETETERGNGNGNGNKRGDKKEIGKENEKEKEERQGREKEKESKKENGEEKEGGKVKVKDIENKKKMGREREREKQLESKKEKKNSQNEKIKETQKSIPNRKTKTKRKKHVIEIQERNDIQLYQKKWNYISPNIIFDRNGGFAWFLSINFRELALKISDPDLCFSFLLRRSGCKLILLQFLQQILCKNINLVFLSRIFDSLNCRWSSAIQKNINRLENKFNDNLDMNSLQIKNHTKGLYYGLEKKINEPPNVKERERERERKKEVKRGEGNGTNNGNGTKKGGIGNDDDDDDDVDNNKQNVTKEEKKDKKNGKENSKFKAHKLKKKDKKKIITQKDIFKYVFKPLNEDPKIKSQYLVNILFEYIKSLQIYNFPIRPFLGEMILNLLFQDQQFFQIHQFIISNIMTNSDKWMNILIQFSKKHNSIIGLILDRLKILNKYNQLISLILENGNIIQSLKLIQKSEIDKEMIFKIFLKIYQLDDDCVFITVYDYLKDILVYDECKQYHRKYHEITTNNNKWVI
ncbi:colon cancer-associated protein mic1 [Anaeramoeba flamelloides]|uniref:Colon cancer-associated protein mic1 n=1 Tax=Anaeramoeba flamelloides TaxID=1746091 RepID=A0ABQ8Y2A2_9EUKA|nr:colon cancer-associated protein mic1 [Anaeramoeba flamelloides]